MLIINGTVVTAEGVIASDVRIRGEKIAELAAGLSPLPGEEVIDASGLLVLPGGVDVHTHMDLLVGTARAADSFLTGSIAAACGGTTTIVDHMAFGPVGCSLQHQLDAYHVLADGKAVIDYGFHGVVGHVDDNVLAEMDQLVRQGVTSLKLYLTYDQRLDDESILRVLARARELGMMICVHCENHAIVSWLRESVMAEGHTQARCHASSRPDYAEAEAVGRMIALSRTVGGAPLYLVHTSAAASLLAADVAWGPDAQDAQSERDAQSESAVGDPHQKSPTPLPVFLETCPQYLTLDAAHYDDPGDEGLKYLMSPPLRHERDREALWEACLDGRIDVIGTDHCPFFFTEKQARGARDFRLCPNGIPGVELRLALMHSEGVVKRDMSLSRFVALTSTLPARRFGLYPQKGTIAVGSDADIVLFDAGREVEVTHELLHEHVDYTPWEGWHVTGWPIMTFSRGVAIMKAGEFIGREGQGRYLHRALPDLER
ncbi:MAG: amidohydrolase family protein [Coriobacteriales bacterium]|jgi:dihydropyrimidinase|nr:amidohydrolase family protein [Coriobacteriales bacterium]